MPEPKPRLLLIDDDRQVLRVYDRAFKSSFEVETNVDAEQAQRRIARGETFDVILCDRQLGAGMSGQDFYESLSADLQGRFVVASGTEPDERDAFAAALGDRFFMKPGSILELVSTLLRVARSAAFALA